MKRRGFLLGAGALAVAPFLPALPVSAKAPVSIALDTTWATGGTLGGSIANTTYYVWAVQNALGDPDIVLSTNSRKPTMPRGYKAVGKYGKFVRTMGNITPFQDKTKA